MTDLIKVDISITYNSSLETIHYWYAGYKSTDVGTIAGAFPLLRERLLIKTLFAKYMLAELLSVVKPIPRSE